VVLGLGLCSLVAMTALAGHAMILLLRLRGKRARRRTLSLPWLAAVLTSTVLLGPLIRWGLLQRHTQLHWVPPMTVGAVYTFPSYLVGSTEVAWLLIGVLLLAATKPSRPVVEMILAAATPLAVTGAVSFAGPSFWVNRYLLFVLMPTVIVAAAGLTRLRACTKPHRQVLPLAIALTVFVAAVIPWQIAVRQPTVKNGSDYRTLASAIVSRQQPGDDLVFEKGRTMRTGVEYYLRHDKARPRDILLEKPAAALGTLTAAEYPGPANRLASATRIWLIAYGRRTDPATARPDLRKLLLGHYRRSGRWEVKDGSMALYVKHP
jgi:mannosyltransferase